MKNQYQELRNRQQEEVNAFPMFFAFDKQQFAEGMRRLGYTGDVQDTLDALGITPQYMEAMPQLKAGLDLACQKVMQNDCF